MHFGGLGFAQVALSHPGHRVIEIAPRPKYPHDIVTDHPFFDDAVFLNVTQGDTAPPISAHSGRAVPRSVGRRANRGVAMRCVETVTVVAGPDDVIGVEQAIRPGSDGLNRILHHRLAAVGQPAARVNHAVMQVMGVNQADVLLLPNLMGTAHDVVNDINVVFVEAGQWLAPRSPWSHQLADVRSSDVRHGHERLDARSAGFGFVCTCFAHFLSGSFPRRHSWPLLGEQTVAGQPEALEDCQFVGVGPFFDELAVADMVLRDAPQPAAHTGRLAKDT